MAVEIGRLGISRGLIAQGARSVPGTEQGNEWPTGAINVVDHTDPKLLS